jgi:hypothetical protein
MSKQLSQSKNQSRSASSVTSTIASSPRHRSHTTVEQPRSPPFLHIDLSGDSDAEPDITYDFSNYDYSSSIVRKRKGVGEIDVPRKRKEMKHKDNFVDLTVPVVWPTVSEIKKNNELFFTYNPLGCGVPNTSEFLYCEHCRCPLIYCNDVVFGPMCYRDVERLICKNGLQNEQDEREVKLFFRSVYHDLVKAKMLMNNSPLHLLIEYRYIRLPRCVKRGSLKRLLDDIKLWTHEEESEEEVVKVPLEPQTPDEDKIITALESADDFPDDLPPLDPPAGISTSTTSASMKVANPYLPQRKRTVVEQAPDISLPVRKLKKALMRIKKE